MFLSFLDLSFITDQVYIQLSVHNLSSFGTKYLTFSIYNNRSTSLMRKVIYKLANNLLRENR